jgi:hypothetical protein
MAIQRSALLDPALKRHWLRVLPHLAPRERDRLRGILRATATGDPPGRAWDGAHP